MHQSNYIPIVDLFAGPGGLGEGFSSVNDGKAFKILVSAEMDGAAHSTLKLRAFYRNLKLKGVDALSSYYNFCNGITLKPYDDNTLSAWEHACIEAQQLTLGIEADNKKLYSIIDKAGLSKAKPWLLIGGPPCQAYSLVGRARNRGKEGYKAEEDDRHYLYREYLKVIQKYKPAVFVMENVKGILSSKIEGKMIFHSILQDLSDPDSALGHKCDVGYKIYSLTLPTVFKRGMDPNSINVHDFIIRAEDYGIPQARHRVILIGVREDLNNRPGQLKKSDSILSVKDAIGNLPALRSRLSKREDSSGNWQAVVNKHIEELHAEAELNESLSELAKVFKEAAKKLSKHIDYGALRLKITDNNHWGTSDLHQWYRDDRLTHWLNHETRGHMTSDLRRYIYASSFAKVNGISPKGHEQFNLKGLKPNHDNWETGKFADRFRVQLYDRPSTTVTSHISKDGHYFIHPDPAQCRSLTVREAARLQTFPDNYFFQGNRTQQYHQAGNAVPPFLARKIGEIVANFLDKENSDITEI
ncbi:DNA cytosine methyltransferase [Methylophilus sp. 3sh_L]|uniref:DNA cytosine methyltransferase n=1 Tax=Methylophilus sp. 3sh_L TaxID=3377114 RepID=UPI00398EE499